MTTPDWIKPYLTARVILTAAGLLLLLVLVAVMFAKCPGYLETRATEKKKLAVNAALANVANKEQQIAEHEKAIDELKGEQKVEKQNVNALTQDYLDSANVATQDRIEANKALANLDAARNANATNVSVKDLEEKLKGL